MSQVAGMMKMRAAISRGSVDDVDSYGLTTARLKDLRPIADQVPCYIWIEQYKDYVDGKSVTLERMKGYFRKDADIQRLDVLTQVLNRNSVVLYEGPIVVDSVVPKVLGAIVSHLELELRRGHGT